MSQDKATYWRKRITGMSDKDLAHWIDGVAHLKLRHQCDCGDGHD